MINSVILVAVGGAVGAMTREFLILVVGTWASFPLGVVVANVGAAFVLGLAFGLHARKVLTDPVYLLVGTGIMGGLSTFSDLALGAVELAKAQQLLLACAYVFVSLALGFAAVFLGVRIAGGLGPPNRSSPRRMGE